MIDLHSILFTAVQKTEVNLWYFFVSQLQSQKKPKTLSTTSTSSTSEVVTGQLCSNIGLSDSINTVVFQALSVCYILFACHFDDCYTLHMFGSLTLVPLSLAGLVTLWLCLCLWICDTSGMVLVILCFLFLMKICEQKTPLQVCLDMLTHFWECEN